MMTACAAAYIIHIMMTACAAAYCATCGIYISNYYHLHDANQQFNMPLAPQ